jgi:hypothetical protein
VQVSQGWRDIKYRTGQQFPLWESTLLRDKAFRGCSPIGKMAARSSRFGRLAGPDPNVGTPPLVFGAFPAFQREAPVLIAPSTGSLVVSGDQALTLTGDRSFTGIVGDGNASTDALDLSVEKNLVIGGFVGGSGLKDIVLRAGQSITVLDGSTISSRQIDIGGNH